MCLSSAHPLLGWVSALALAIFPFPAGAKHSQGKWNRWRTGKNLAGTAQA